jgi:hypothetical protein
MVESMTKYTARCRRSGRWWAIEIPEVNGGIYSQARRLDGVEAIARDAIALTLDVSPDSFAVEVVAVLPDEWETELEEAREARRTAVAAERQAQAALDRVVRRLVDAGLTVRDVGALLGLSYQRIAKRAGRSAAGDRPRLTS